MPFSWFKRRSRDRIRRAVQHDQWHSLCDTHLWQYPALTNDEQHRLHTDAAILVAEKNWEGCFGFTINDESKRIIAAQIALMTLGHQDEYFERVLSILVYPNAYRAKEQTPAGHGIVIEGMTTRVGEAWHRGPVILSWPDVARAGRGPNRGHHLVVHEFAHQLDMRNGGHADGVPPMVSKAQEDRWLSVCSAAYERQVEDCEWGRRPLVNRYGATNRAEFFSVTSEAFFQMPHILREGDAELFDVLREFYGQDPLRWAPVR
jgi:Mlc titration factor MtfA (ptsG expression regulator)